MQLDIAFCCTIRSNIVLLHPLLGVPSSETPNHSLLSIEISLMIQYLEPSDLEGLACWHDECDVVDLSSEPGVLCQVSGTRS